MSSMSLDWWNRHFEEIAAYEPQYEKLNEIMKWSLIIGWLNDSNKGHRLNFLESVAVNHQHWFPDWVKKNPQLKFSRWKDVGFYKKGYKQCATEAMPVISSEPFDLFDTSYQVTGGVSLGSKQTFKGRTSLSKSYPGFLRRSNSVYESFFSLQDELTTTSGIRYKMNSAGPYMASVTSKAPEAARLRSISCELANRSYERTLRTSPGRTRIEAAFDGHTMGSLDIRHAHSDIQVTWNMGYMEKGKILAHKLSSRTDFEAFLKKSPDVKQFIHHPDDTSYLIDLGCPKKWVQIAPENNPSMTVPEGWLSRVSDPASGRQNLNIKWIDKDTVLNQVNRDGTRWVKSLPNGDHIMVDNMGQAGQSKIKSDLERALASANYPDIAKRIASDPQKVKQFTAKRLADKIDRIDHLTENGYVNRASRELKGAIDEFGKSPELLDRKNIVDISQRLRKVNQINDECLVFTVEDHLSHYSVYDGTGRAIYSGNNFSDMGKKIFSRLDNTGKAVYLDMKDFQSPQKIRAFETSLNIQKRHFDKDVSLKSLFRETGGTEFQDMFFSRGIEITSNPIVETIGSGSYRGWKKITIPVSKWVRGVLTKFSISVKVKTQEMADAFVSRIKARYGKPIMLESKSPADLINLFRKDLQKEYHLNEKELIFEFEDQIGNIQTVLIMKNTNREIACDDGYIAKNYHAA